MENHNFIYKITSPSGRVYIGRTNDINRRYKEYKSLGCKKQPIIYNSIKKYGWENHIFEIIESELSYKDSFILELEHIYFYKKLGISLNCSIQLEHEKINSVKKCVSIVQLDLEGNFIKEWDSIALASRKLNLSQGNISRAISSINRSEGGFLWIYKKDYTDDFKSNYIKNWQKLLYSKCVEQYDKNNNFLNKFESITEAVEKTGLSKSTIHRLLNGKIKNGRYKFKYCCK